MTCDELEPTIKLTGTLLIVAPFWGMEAHVGVHRVDRFVRWAAQSGVRVVLVRAGSGDAITKATWGQVVTVRDPLGFYRDGLSARGAAPPPRRANAMRRAVATTVLSPDPGVVWARRAARHPMVLAAGEGARWVISSSPPESAHLAAWRLARTLGAAHLADFRDGWLDEPLKPALSEYAVRRWHETRWEARVVGNAAHVFVTSPVWRDLLTARYPAARGKTGVLTNGYPPGAPFPDGGAPFIGHGPPTLLHAGRFTTSRDTQTVERLLAPLLGGVRRSGIARGRVCLLGDLSARDRGGVQPFVAPYADAGWTLQVVERVPRAAALSAVSEASGLLLLAATSATLPSKLFEYLPARRPILAVTRRGSAVWQVCEQLAHAYLVDEREPTWADAAAAFVRASAAGERATVVPAEYSETALAFAFLRELARART